MLKRSTILAMIAFLMASAFLLAPKTSLAETWSVGNYTPFNPIPVSKIYWPSMTHINHVAARPTSAGNLDITTDNMAGSAPALIAAAHAKGVKVLLSVQTGASTNYFKTAIENNLTGFVNSIISNVNTYGYDGVDIDWESCDYNSATVQTDMTNLITKLRGSLAAGKLLTVDAATSPVDARYWSSKTIAIYNKLDRINVMTYDESGLGNWNPYTWHNSALNGTLTGTGAVVSFESVRQNYLAGGLPASKLNLGLAFYGDVVTGVCQTSACTSGVTGPRQSFLIGSGSSNQQTYAQIKATYGSLDSSNPNWHWDSVADVPYLSITSSTVAGDKFVTYDDPQSLTDKINYIKSNGLGGWIMWMNDQEYNANSVTDAQKYPLSSAVAATLDKNAVSTTTNGGGGGSGSGGQQIATTSKPTVTTNVATNVTTTKATLNGLITNTGNLPINFANTGFYYGTSTAYGHTFTASTTGTSSIALTANLSSLISGTTYHFQAFATNASGTATGIDQSFTTTITAPVATTTQVITDLWFGHDIKYNQTDSDIIGLQTFLKYKNTGTYARALPSTPTSVLNLATTKAIIEWQKVNGLCITTIDTNCDGILSNTESRKLNNNSTILNSDTRGRIDDMNLSLAKTTVISTGKVTYSIALKGQVLGVKVYADGTLLRSVETGRIYVIVNGQKQYIPTIAKLKSYGKKPIYNVNEEELANY